MSITDLITSKSSFGDSQKSVGFIQGTVVENNNPEFKGMVKVQLTVFEEGQDDMPWVRLLAPYGGKEYGNYIVPEIDDIVIVGFIAGNLDHPFLLGSLYPEEDAMVDESFDDKNYIKHFKTKGGMDVSIYDKDAEQSVTVTTPKGSVITMEDKEETCLVSDKDGKNKLFFDYKNGELEILADKKITVKTGSVEMVLDGEADKYSLKADKIETKGGTSIKTEAGSTLDMKGPTSKLEGNQVTVKGSAQTVISGGIVKIN